MNPLYYLKALIAALTSTCGVLTLAANARGNLTVTDWVVAIGTGVVTGTSTFAAGNKEQPKVYSGVDAPADASEFPTEVFPGSAAPRHSVNDDASLALDPPASSDEAAPASQ